MGFWKKLFNDKEERMDYYREGMDLLGVQKYHEALTSFRLALRESPRDTTILQQIAITYTRIGMTDEAMKTYKSVLEKDPGISGAHYGLAFLLIREGRADEAVVHLKEFLARAPKDSEAQRHVEHARQTLSEIAASGADASGAEAATG